MATEASGKDWTKSLKPGDKVIRVSIYDSAPIEILDVKRVTPSGIVHTNIGNYKPRVSSSFLLRAYPYGSRGGPDNIVPYTNDLAMKAQKEMDAEEERKAKQNRKAKAKDICNKVYLGVFSLSDEKARKIIELFQEQE